MLSTVSGMVWVRARELQVEFYFTTRRCRRDVLESLGAFNSADTSAFVPVAPLICFIFFFCNHSLNLLTLNPSMSITFFMERGPFKL